MMDLFYNGVALICSGSAATYPPHIVFTVSWNRCDPRNGQECERTGEHVQDN